MNDILTKPTADDIAEMADRGEDISPYFSNEGAMKYPTQHIHVEMPTSMFHELESLAAELQSVFRP